MKIQPKEILVNLPIALTFSSSEKISEFATNINSILHGKTRLKYDELGQLEGQFVGLFYLQRNEEYHFLRNNFVNMINLSEMGSSIAQEQEKQAEDEAERTFFTLGNTKSYDAVLKGNFQEAVKQGATAEYEGGIIFKTSEDALTFLNSSRFDEIDWGDTRVRYREDFSVYRVLLPHSWEEDVKLLEEDQTFRLQVDAKFFR